MTGKFLITGLPRSRTAWWAVAMTTSVSFCHHEPLTDRADSFNQVCDLWTKGPRPYGGMSDSLLGFRLGEILERIQPRTLIVSRPLADVDVSLARIGIQSQPYCGELIGALEPWLSHPLVRVVDFEALNDISMVAECMRWLCPNAPIDSLRLSQLSHMNIQTDLGRAKRAAAMRYKIVQRFREEAEAA